MFGHVRKIWLAIAACVIRFHQRLCACGFEENGSFPMEKGMAGRILILERACYITALAITRSMRVRIDASQCAVTHAKSVPRSLHRIFSQESI